MNSDVAPRPAPCPAQQGDSTLPSLTGLRYVAAVFVLGYHFLYLTTGRAQSLLLPIFGHGGAAVALFFCLSGFVLAWRYQPTARARTFYRRRFARLGPTYVLSWIAAGIVLYALHMSTSLTTGLLVLFVVQSWVPHYTVYFGWNGVAWSLCCEAFFYALFPFVLRALDRARTSTLYALTFGLALTVIAESVVAYWVTPTSGPLYAQLGFGGWLLYICPLGRLPEFLLGCVLGVAFRRDALPRISPLLAIVWTVFAYIECFRVPHLASQTGILVVPFAMLVVSLAQSDRAGRKVPVLHLRPLVVLGDWSYAVYLFHGMMIEIAARHLAAFARPAVALMWLGAVILAASAVAALVNRVVAQPGRSVVLWSPRGGRPHWVSHAH